MEIQPDTAESCAYLAKDLVLTLCLPREGPCAYPPTSLSVERVGAPLQPVGYRFGNHDSETGSRFGNPDSENSPPIRKSVQSDSETIGRRFGNQRQAIWKLNAPFGKPNPASEWGTGRNKSRGVSANVLVGALEISIERSAIGYAV
jgi:hypothetical protein